MASGKPDNPRQPISPAVRQRLQAFFKTGSSAAAKGTYDYATEMFSQCVLGDPANVIYAQNLLGNLQKQYGNNKKGSKMAMITGASSRAQLKRATMSKDWNGAVKAGVELLKLNPWDTSALTVMAEACQALQCDEAELVYVKASLDANIKDPEINRLAGRSLARQGKFDEALVCWRRVTQHNPLDEEAMRAISDLHVERTIHHGGYEDAQSSNDVRAVSDDDDDGQEARFTPERQLERAILKHPTEISNYRRLIDMHLHNGRLEEAESVLSKALSATGGELSFQEQLEDLRIRKLKEQSDLAKQKAEREKTDEAKELYKRFRTELFNAELEYYRTRADRYPQNVVWKYELGIRLQQMGNYNEAIKNLQEARADQQRKGQVLLALGQCFYQIKQYPLAMRNLEQAAEEISEKELEKKKQALYWAGALAQALKNWAKADHFFTELAGFDFSYKDVAERLDKIHKLRDDGGLGPAPV